MSSSLYNLLYFIGSQCSLYRMAHVANQSMGNILHSLEYGMPERHTESIAVVQFADD